MSEIVPLTVTDIILRLVVAALVGAIIGYERRMHHKAIGIAGMMLVALGSTTYMLMAHHEAERDPAALGRTIQGILRGSGFSAAP
jgi:putative Mg2+ transporter-C (MgtC) family protein